MSKANKSDINFQNYISHKGINEGRIVLHSDLNNFFASVECANNPDLYAFPIAVCGEAEKRHGIVLAKNQLAKKYGVKTAETIWQAKQKCPKLKIIPPNYSLYMRYANTARKIYNDYSDRVEPFGMDEAWIELTGCPKMRSLSDGKELADKIRQRIYDELGITASVGVSDNKAFAKLASDYKKPNATTLFCPENYERLILPLDISEILFAGRSTCEKLSGFGVKTIGDAVSLSMEFFKTVLGKCGELLYYFISGFDYSPVAAAGEAPPVKSIGNSVTCPRDLLNLQDVKLMCYILSENVCTKLREASLKCSGIQLHIRDTGLKSIERQKMLSFPTCNAKDIAEAAFELFPSVYDIEKKSVRTLGVRACPLTGDKAVSQLSLFENYERRIKFESIDKTVDELRSRFGKQSVRRAVTLCGRGLTEITTGYEVFTHNV